MCVLGGVQEGESYRESDGVGRQFDTLQKDLYFQKFWEILGIKFKYRGFNLNPLVGLLLFII